MSSVADALNALRLAVQPFILMALLFGFWVGLRRAGFAGRERRRPWLIVAGLLLAWYFAALVSAQADAFAARPDRPLPAIPLAILIPVGLGLVLLLRWRRMTAVLAAVPPSWLVGAQVFRVFGGVFLALWAEGRLPGAFALPAGLGDVTVGALAVAVAALLRAGAPGARAAAVGWNLLGIADLVVALATGFLTSPGRFQMLALEQPNLLTTAYPLVMIPAFAVPLSLIMHGLSLRQLLRAAPSYDGRPGAIGLQAAG